MQSSLSAWLLLIWIDLAVLKRSVLAVFPILGGHPCICLQREVTISMSVCPNYRLTCLFSFLPVHLVNCLARSLTGVGVTNVAYNSSELGQASLTKVHTGQSTLRHNRWEGGRAPSHLIIFWIVILRKLYRPFGTTENENFSLFSYTNWIYKILVYVLATSITRPKIPWAWTENRSSFRYPPGWILFHHHQCFKQRHIFPEKPTKPWVQPANCRGRQNFRKC